MLDFTLKTYRKLLLCLQTREYTFQTLTDFIRQAEDLSIILRHDVDRKPKNALVIAKIERDANITASYYFRIVKESYDERVIKRIAEMGHEIGYHYENMDTCNGDVDSAWDDFQYNLDKLRKITEVKTICMHGSPRSEFDNKALWEKYDYRSLDIIGEPYYDINFDDVFYLTDTGHRWDGWEVSIRDKVPQQEQWNKEGLIFHSTNDIIKVIKENKLPNKIMFTMHPQRWTNNPILWTKELLMQYVKNQVKKYLI
jgi:hypothetical protein